MKIGIYGGTFNPPHLGHIAAAETAVRTLGLDKLILIPAAVPPHKELPQDTPSPEHRLAMVEQMADSLGLPGVVEVSDQELRRTGKSYTIDTLRELRGLYPEAKLWLLMGTDMFLSFHTWRQPQEIADLAGLCAFGRSQQDGEGVFAQQRDDLARKFGARVVTFTLPNVVDVSSTQLRAQLARGEGGAQLLPAVYGYILRNRLYGTHADLKRLDIEELRACSYSMVRQKRVRHIRGTEEEAVRLARRWGADEVLARRAGILHDCTKYLDLDEQLALCRQYGVELDGLERNAVKLLHSKTGACIAKAVYGEPEEVFDAIWWHTTGHGNMTTLEKVLYIADYIEPNRDFEGVEELRRLAYEDLDRALLMGLEMTIEEMHQRGNPIHQKTLEARDWLRGQGITLESDKEAKV